MSFLLASGIISPDGLNAVNITNAANITRVTNVIDMILSRKKFNNTQHI